MDGNTPEEIERGLVYDRVRKAYARKRAKATGGWVFVEDQVEVWACPFADLFNGLMSPVWENDSAERLWRRAIALYKGTGQDMFVSVGPSCSPSSLPMLAKRDHFHRSAEVPFMHLDLGEMKTYPQQDGLRIERIVDFSFFEKHRHPWLGPVNTPYRKLKLQFLRQYGEGDSPRLWQFVALQQRKLIGGATVFVHANEAAIFDVAVDGEYRKKGVGTRLVGEACGFAREAGIRAVGLGASGQGIGLYRKLGFVDAGRYCDFFLSRAELARISNGSAPSDSE